MENSWTLWPPLALSLKDSCTGWLLSLISQTRCSPMVSSAPLLSGNLVSHSLRPSSRHRDAQTFQSTPSWKCKLSVAPLASALLGQALLLLLEYSSLAGFLLLLWSHSSRYFIILLISTMIENTYEFLYASALFVLHILSGMSGQ